MCQLLVQQFFNLFAQLKTKQNLMKIMFSCIHFPIWPYPLKIMIFYIFYTGKLYGLTGMLTDATVSSNSKFHSLWHRWNHLTKEWLNLQHQQSELKVCHGTGFTITFCGTCIGNSTIFRWSWNTPCKFGYKACSWSWTRRRFVWEMRTSQKINTK